MSLDIALSRLQTLGPLWCEWQLLQMKLVLACQEYERVGQLLPALEADGQDATRVARLQLPAAL